MFPLILTPQLLKLLQFEESDGYLEYVHCCRVHTGHVEDTLSVPTHCVAMDMDGMMHSILLTPVTQAPGGSPFSHRTTGIYVHYVPV